MGNDCVALGLMCKAPVEGLCKTRLCPPLTMAEAAEMSRRFIADVAAVIADAAPAAGARGVAVYSPAGAEAVFAGLLPDGFATLGQRGDDLGERLLHATADLLVDGCGGVCLINADSPTLPASLLRRTVEALRRPGDRIVLGPAVDGGYYLVGMKRLHAELFEGIAWSTGQVLAQTLGRAADLGLPTTLLPVWYDVDDLASLRLLMHELFGDGLPLAVDGLRGSPARRSREYLQALLEAPGPRRFGLPAFAPTA
jgi:uncharacterized protein